MKSWILSMSEDTDSESSLSPFPFSPHVCTNTPASGQVTSLKLTLLKSDSFSDASTP